MTKRKYLISTLIILSNLLFSQNKFNLDNKSILMYNLDYGKIENIDSLIINKKYCRYKITFANNMVVSYYKHENTIDITNKANEYIFHFWKLTKDEKSFIIKKVKELVNLK